MALMDMIARSGGANFETMRKGWLPNPEEKASRRMAELQAQRQQQIIEAEPQRRRLADLQLKTAESEFEYLPTKRKQSEQKFELDVKHTKAITEKAEYEMGQLKTEDEAKQYIVNQEKIGKHLNSANQLKTNKDKRTYLNRYREEILAAGDDEEDAAFKSVMKMTGDQFNQSFGLVLQGNKYLQGLAEKRLGKSSSFQNLDTGKIETVMYNDPKYTQKVNDVLGKNYKAINTMSIQQTGTPKDLGLTKSQTGDAVETNIKNQKITRRGINGLTKLRKIINSDEYIGGATGDVVKTVNNFAAQARQIFGADSVIKNGKLDMSKIKTDSPEFSRLRKSAIKGNQYDSAIIELAYIKAKSLDEGGRVTDADLRYAMQILAAGADKASLNALIDDNIDRSLDNYNIGVDVDNQYRTSKGLSLFPRLTREGVLNQMNVSKVRASRQSEIAKKQKQNADRLKEIRRLKNKRSR